jgi:hypothetical protein
LLPDPHEVFYQKLAALTGRVSIALKEMDPDVLMFLADEQDMVVQEIQNAGAVADDRLLERVQALSGQVSDVITEIQQRQQDISIRIKRFADGRKLVHAYVT